MEHKNTCLPLIEDLSNAFGPSGFEDDVLTVLRRYGSHLGSFSGDHLRNLYLHHKENTGNSHWMIRANHTSAPTSKNRMGQLHSSPRRIVKPASANRRDAMRSPHSLRSIGCLTENFVVCFF